MIEFEGNVEDELEADVQAASKLEFEADFGVELDAVVEIEVETVGEGLKFRQTWREVELEADVEGG